jgi:hypothetical protein
VRVREVTLPDRAQPDQLSSSEIHVLVDGSGDSTH